MGPQILRAGEISGGLLVLLLLATVGYALTGRRRRAGALPAVTTQWVAGQAQSRYPHHSQAEANRMLEYFAAPLPAPGQAAGQLAGPRPAIAALASGTLQPDDDLFLGTEPVGDTGRWIPHGPASRAISRRPAVAGSPPWEAAAAPDGELPWTGATGRQTVPGQVVASGYPRAEPAARDSDLGEAPPSPASWQSDWPSEPQHLTRSAPPDWADRTDWTSAPVRRDETDRTAASEHPSRPDWARPGVGIGAAGGEPSVTSAARHERLDQADWYPTDDDSSTTGQHRSGLPIRQPRVVTGPLSPSGSLWEPAESGGSLWDRAAGDQAGATAERPIYIWDPAQPAADSRAGPPGELANPQDERSLPGRPTYPEY
jgi:hypothetical protein